MLAVVLALPSRSHTADAPGSFQPDIVVAADGSGDFRSIQAALDSIPEENHDRRLVLIRDGTYAEKIRVVAPWVTLRGESRTSTRIAFAQSREAYQRAPDDIGAGVVNLSATANDCVIENLTIENTQEEIGPHAFAIFGVADRTVIIDCDVLSQGADTLSLWRGRAAEGETRPGPRDGGRYYHARLRVRGSVDFICPRGWCFMRDSEITQVNPRASAAIWHDGSKNPDMKFVLRSCRFDGPPEWLLARWHHDAQFFLLDCTFSAMLRDRAPYRVFYPTDGGTPTAADRERNAGLEATNRWGERVYFFNCHRTGGDYSWLQDNLAAAPGAPRPEEITAAWTFAHTWDPERVDRPTIRGIAWGDGRVTLHLSENVTVQGSPHLVMRDGVLATFASGSGSDTLTFTAAQGAPRAIRELNLDRGAIIASEATATLRFLDPDLPASP